MHVIFEPLDFIARLAALLPRPGVNLTRFHGALAPNSKYRARVTPPDLFALDQHPNNFTGEINGRESGGSQWFIARNNKNSTKLCLQVNSEQDVLDYHENALRHGLKSFLIKDSGGTVFVGTPTLTACSIGQASASRIDAVTGELSLY